MNDFPGRTTRAGVPEHDRETSGSQLEGLGEGARTLRPARGGAGNGGHQFRSRRSRWNDELGAPKAI